MTHVRLKKLAQGCREEPWAKAQAFVVISISYFIPGSLYAFGMSQSELQFFSYSEFLLVLGWI